MAEPTSPALFDSSNTSFSKFFEKARYTPEFWEAMGQDKDQAATTVLKQFLGGVNRKMQNEAKEKANQSIEELANNKNKGLGKYSKLRQVVKSQLESGGVEQVPTPELRSRDSKSVFSGSYYPETRNIKIAEALSPQDKASVLRHEKAHDFQRVGKQLKEPISSNWERLTWLESKGEPGVKSAIGNIASEIQARAVQNKSTPKALLSMAMEAKDYVGDTLNPVEKALYKGIGMLEQPAKLTTKAIKSGIPQKIGNVAKGLGAGLASGLAEAPKYEFLNPPSAGPSDPDDPVYQYERGLISQAEFNRRMGK
jgi:hypothetical protein